MTGRSDYKKIISVLDEMKQHVLEDVKMVYYKYNGMSGDNEAECDAYYGKNKMLPFFKDIPLGHGPNKNIGIALQKLSQNILSLNQGEDLFISPDWPRFLWKIQASLCFWYPRAKKNGLKKKELKNKTD